MGAKLFEPLNQERIEEYPRQIILNQIKTPDGTIIRSMNRHDYVTHLDKNGKEYMVDGGMAYLRRNRHDDAPYEELSIYSDCEYEVFRESLHRGGRGKDGKQPLTYVPLSKMSDEWLKACIDYNTSLGLENNLATHSYITELAYRDEKGIKIADE